MRRSRRLRTGASTAAALWERNPARADPDSQFRRSRLWLPIKFAVVGRARADCPTAHEDDPVPLRARHHLVQGACGEKNEIRRPALDQGSVSVDAHDLGGGRPEEPAPGPVRMVEMEEDRKSVV